MQKIIVAKNEAGQRMDKLLAKHLDLAPKSFFYKMLRKKNITLNGKKAQGNEKLNIGDEITLFLADDTIEKFRSNKEQKLIFHDVKKVESKPLKLHVLYEDEDYLFINKPSGVLSQKATAADLSINEHLIFYLLEKGEVTEGELQTFKPSICNRLDRNTSGVIGAGKTLYGLQTLSEAFHDRTMKKYYLTIVSGILSEPMHLKGYLLKDEKNNKVTIYKEPHGDAKAIETAYEPIGYGENCTLLKVHLITGRTHQIRAHLSSIGHSVIGDRKYGSQTVNQYYEKKYRLHDQLLHAWKLVFDHGLGDRQALDGQTIMAPVSPMLHKIIKGEEITWQPGEQED